MHLFLHVLKKEARRLKKNRIRLKVIGDISRFSPEIQQRIRRVEELTAEDYTAGLPPPDLLIRTSGEQRISNFLLWQCAYSEFYFTDTLWPDFGRNELQQALLSYARRQRRFGKTSEQVEAEILC